MIDNGLDRDKRTYSDQGYVVFRGVLDRTTVERLSEHVEQNPA
jgi:hypothetical protein